MKLDVNNPLPLHVQLKYFLSEEIRSGKYIDKIPSERELMDRFLVSRSTVREAISGLVREGILEKKHGKGTFISLRPVQEWLGYLSSYDETVKKTGMVPSSKLLYHGKESSCDIVAILGVNEYYLIERLRLANNKPVAIKKHYYPIEIGNQLAKYDLNSAVLYDLLESDLGIKLRDAEQLITSGTPSKKVAQYLEISKRSSVLIKEQLIFDVEIKPVEYSKSFFRPDMYSFHMKMSRNRNTI